MKGDALQVRDSLFTAYRHVGRAVRDDRWHLIVYPHINKTQLFDLQNDPHEIKDLAADPAHAKTIDRLTVKLKDWQQQYGDKQPLQSDKPAPLEFDFSKVPAEKKKAGKQTSNPPISVAPQTRVWLGAIGVLAPPPQDGAAGNTPSSISARRN